MMDFSKAKLKQGMSPEAKKAKLTALKEANKMASDMMKEDLVGLKKVTVAADSKTGLKKGLEKAEEVLGLGQKDEEHGCSGEDCEGCEDCSEMEDEGLGEKEQAKASGYKDQQEESEPMDLDELDKKIAELMKMKEKLQK